MPISRNCPAPFASSENRLTALNVLIVEDSPDDAELMLLELTRRGCDPVWRRVENADEMRSALVEGSWDVVLSDYSLPGFGAPQALALLKEIDPDLPFIVVSGTIGEELAVAMMRTGASDYLLKENLIRLVPTIEREMRETNNRRARRKAEQAAAHLAAIVQFSGDAIIGESLDGVVTSWNPAAERLYGWTAAETVGLPISLFVPPDRREELGVVIEQIRRGQRVEPFETVRLHKDGSRIDVAITLSPVRDENGQCIGVSKIARDIRGKKRAEAEVRRQAEFLRKSEEHYRALANSVPGGVFTTTAEGRCDYCNQWWCDYTGLTLEQSIGDGWSLALHPDDREQALVRWRECLGIGRPFQAEYRFRRADGVYRWFLTRTAPLADSEGRVAQWFGTCTDIEDQKQAEGVLAREALLLSNVRDAVIVTDLEGVVTYWNEGAARLFGWTAQERLGRPLVERLLAPARRSAASAVRAIASGAEWSGEHEEYRKDGSRVWIDARTTLIRDRAGRPACIMSVSHDVTARKRAEAERDQVLARLRMQIDRMPLGYLLFDADLRLIDWNSAAERNFGYSKEEVLGMEPPFAKIIPAAAWPQLQEVLRRLRAGDMAANSVNDNLTKDGRTITCEWYNTPLMDNGVFLGLLSLAQDITEKRSLEEQLRQAQKMEAIGQLAGGIAHDFNNLLTIIQGYSDLLLQRMKVGDPARGLVEEIHRAGERSAALTRQLLVFSRKAIIEARVLDLNAVIADAEKMLRRMIGEDVRLETALRARQGRVKADAGQLEQVLMNLAVNARDAMPRGGRLTIATDDVELDADSTLVQAGVRPGSYALLAVSDSGCGMSEEVKKRIFEPFFTTKGPTKGTGLGLAVVHGIVKQADGHVEVESEEGVGTTFKVYLPQIDKLVQPSRSLSDIKVGPPGTETVLLAEDEAGVRALTRHVLADCGYKVLEASDGNEALRVAEQHKEAIHLVITDVVMPDLGGRLLVEQVLSLHPEAKVLYMSGYPDDAVVRHGILQEKVRFLQKPFSPVALAFTIRGVLDGA